MRTDAEHEVAWVLALNAFRFVYTHPYLASGLVGAAAGSAVTYRVMTLASDKHNLRDILTPKLYQLELTPDDLRRMLRDPETEIRVETTDMTVVVTGERRAPLKQLPVMEG